jgi:hypothetical protein
VQTFTEGNKPICSAANTQKAIKWVDIHDVFFLTTAHEDVLVEEPSSRGAHHNTKPAALLDYKYKIGVDWSDCPIIHLKGRQ